MKRLFLFLAATILALPLTSLPFVALNNVTALPWELTWMLWFGFPPLYAFTVGALYGGFHFKKGGGVFAAALFFAVAIYAANRYGMPFANDLAEMPLLIAAAVLAVVGEIYGSAKQKSRIKKRNARRSAPDFQ